jgi:tetratricopeptide (TPR) repeat protein
MEACTVRPCLPRKRHPGHSATTKLKNLEFMCVAAILTGAQAIIAWPTDASTTELQAASTFHNEGNYCRSIPILKHIVERSNENYVANLLLGEDLLHSGNVHDSLAPLRTASRAQSDDGTARAYLAEAAAEMGDLSTASSELESAVTRSGEGEQFLLAWADFSLDRFRKTGAFLQNLAGGEAEELRFEAAQRPEGSDARESFLERSAAIDPKQRGIWGELGLAQFDLGQRSQAQQSLQEALQFDPQGAETLDLDARFAASVHHWSDAQDDLALIGSRSPAELRRSLAFWPRTLVPGSDIAGPIWNCVRSPEVGCLLASAQPIGGETLSAIDLYAEGRWEQLTALPQVRSTNTAEFLWRGVAFVKMGYCAKAIPLLERGMKADGRTAGFWLEVCYTSEIERTAAQLNAHGMYSALHELKGDVMLQLHGQAEPAQKEYLEALKSRPKNPRLLEKLAETYAVLGNTANARTAALSALSADPRQSSALQTLAQMALNDRSYSEALTLLKRLRTVDPKSAWARVQTGVAYGQLDHPEEAVRYLRPELSAGYPDEKGALHAMLAIALRKVGRMAEAEQAAAEASKLANSSLEDAGPGSTNGPK